MKKLLYILLFVPLALFGQNISYVEQDIPLELQEGWNMFGYSCYEPMDVIEAFSPVVDKVVIVKDNSGAVYMTEFGFNGIGNLQYNQGYQIKTTQAITDFQFCSTIVPFFPQYQIGDLIEDGIVFYVDESGEKGLVAAMEDIGSFEWGCDGTIISGADGQAVGAGYQNTLDIVAGCSETPIAASEALAYESAGYSDWYLPSRYELTEMYYAIGNGGPEGNIGGFSNSYYWSSSKNGSNPDAWYVQFDNGATYYYDKSNPTMVRPIRAFGYTVGCMDETACNYNPEANMADGSCIYPEQGYDCDGNITEYVIGMQAEGGIVFYIDETGEHGLVAALEYIGQFKWGCYGEYVDGADGTSIGTGYQNTMDIVHQGCSTENGGITAAQAALDVETNGYSDWYLPSKDELLEIYNSIGNGGPEGNIGDFSSTYYWSSSESNNNLAWGVFFGNGLASYASKFYTNGVRVIRAF